MKFIKDFKGFSGCKIKLYSDNGNYFVRKISKSIDYNNRLKNQVQKQKFFLENMSSNNITAPIILKDGFDNKLFFFDMEYVQGINLIDHIYNANIEELLKISEDICKIIKIMKISQKEEFVNFSALIKKISDIESELSIKNLGIDNTIKDMKNLAEEMLNYKINATFCHGDLVMDNIIYDKTNNKYYLIDFLDLFIEHYWFDISTLFQDIEGKWYKFRNPEINFNNMVPRLKFVNDYINKNLLKEEEIYMKHHNLFLATKFLRILPYAQDKDIDYLLNVIVKNIEIAKSRNIAKD